MTQYNALWDLSKRSHILDGISGLLGWDQETYMPTRAASIRAKQRELLTELSHQIKTSVDFEKYLSELIDLDSGEIKPGLDTRQEAAIRAWRRDFLRLKKLPTAFVQQLTKITSEAVHVWQQAKRSNDFLLFKPYLAQIVTLMQKKADLLGFSEHPYDALLDEYEPECKTKYIDALFHEIKTSIAPLVKKLATKPANPILQIPMNYEEQIAVCQLVLDCIGYDRQKGRLDLSSHPFSSSCHPTDCRITTRLEPHGFFMQVLTTLHEAGHSLYEMGLPEEHYGSPLGEHSSLGIHESQSRFWETRIGRSFPFWEFFFPKLKERFPGRFDAVDLNALFAHMNQVKPSLIRVDADEVTYPLHVILRFEMEKELIEGTLSVENLPERWNQAMVDMLGIEPKSDQEGCLQDIHWSMGGFGYFPTYTLGNVYAAELFHVFEKDHPDWQGKVSAGDFAFIKEWNHKNIHSLGRQYSSQELMQRITKRAISSHAYLKYLKDKYF